MKRTHAPWLSHMHTMVFEVVHTAICQWFETQAWHQPSNSAALKNRLHTLSSSAGGLTRNTRQTKDCTTVHAPWVHRDRTQQRNQHIEVQFCGLSQGHGQGMWPQLKATAW